MTQPTVLLSVNTAWNAWNFRASLLDAIMRNGYRAVVAAPAEQRPKKPRKKRGESAKPRTEKDLLLDSVLNALPEPKAPGQGRSRRRVTTAALTGTPVPHLPTQE